MKKSAARWMLRVAGKKRGCILALTLIQGLAGVTDVFYALLFRGVVDSAVAGDGGAFRRYICLIVGLVVLQISLSTLIRWLYELTKADVENTFKQRLVDNILRKDYASVSEVHTAEWLNRITGDTVVVADGAVDILPELVETVVRLVSALVMLVLLDRWFAAILVPAGAVMIVLSYAFRRMLKRLHRAIQESDGRLRVFLQERISSLIVIKAFDAERSASAGAAEKMADHKAARLRRNRLSNIVNVGLSGAMEGVYLICVVYCAHGIMTGRISYGTLTAVMQLVGQVQGPFARFSGFLPRWYAMTASAERLMEAEAFADDCQALEASRAQALYRESLRAFGLRDATFAYPSPEDEPGAVTAEDMTPVIRGLSLEIQKGEYVALTGRSGCGKSTLLKLLMCMYPLDAGERFLSAGEGELPLTAEWRGLFAYVPQGNQMMNGSLREVVSIARPEDAGDDAKLLRALTIACADAFLPELENGLDTQLGERGAGLSEGQLQRLAIARAVFSDRPVLLLDEATSALDEKTEKRLLENLRGLTDKTVVFVTHRKEALRICDRVFLFTEDGVVRT